MSDCRSCSGRLFHSVVPAVAKERSPNWLHDRSMTHVRRMCMYVCIVLIQPFNKCIVSQHISVEVDIVGVCRLAELEDQIQQKSRELVTTKAQLDCVEADKVDLKQRVDSLNKQKNNLEQMIKQSDKHGVVSCYSGSCFGSLGK